MVNYNAEQAPAADTEQGVDMTELMAAIALLNDEEPPSGPVIVPISAFPGLEKIQREEAKKEEEKQAEAAKLADLKEKIQAHVFNQHDGVSKVAEAILKEAALHKVRVVEDGSIYLGRFKDSDGKRKDWYAAAEDATDKKGNRLLLEFQQAAKYAKKSKAHGHHDWMVPPGHWDRDGRPDILNEIFNSKSKINGLNVSGADFDTMYWSSSPTNISNSDDGCANVQWFNNGHQTFESKWHDLSVRLVRSVPVGENLFGI